MDQIIKEKGFVQLTDDGAIQALVDKVVENNPKQLSDYKAGKDKLFGFFVGQVMKESKGQASPEVVNRLLKEKLK